MKTNTIQIIRILCLRPASMPSRDSPAGIRAQPDPKRRTGPSKTKAAQAGPFPRGCLESTEPNSGTHAPFLGKDKEIFESQFKFGK